MTENTENTETGAAERRLGFWLRAASRAVRTQFVQSARGGAEDPAAIAAEIDGRIAAAISPEDYATTAATLEAIARELGWDENAPWAREHGFGRGFRHGFGHGFDTDAADRGAAHGFGRRFGRDADPHDDVPPCGGHRGRWGHRGHRGGHRFAPAPSGEAPASEASFERGFEAGFRAAARS